MSIVSPRFVISKNVGSYIASGIPCQHWMSALSWSGSYAAMNSWARSVNRFVGTSASGLDPLPQIRKILSAAASASTTFAASGTTGAVARRAPFFFSNFTQNHGADNISQTDASGMARTRANRNATINLRGIGDENSPTVLNGRRTIGYRACDRSGPELRLRRGHGRDGHGHGVATDRLTLRGSWGTSFKGPSISQTAAATQFTGGGMNGVFVDGRRHGAMGMFFAAFETTPNPDLLPQTSENISPGLSTRNLLATSPPLNADSANRFSRRLREYSLQFRYRLSD